MTTNFTVRINCSNIIETTSEFQLGTCRVTTTTTTTLDDKRLDFVI